MSTAARKMPLASLGSSGINRLSGSAICRVGPARPCERRPTLLAHRSVVLLNKKVGRRPPYSLSGALSHPAILRVSDINWLGGSVFVLAPKERQSACHGCKPVDCDPSPLPSPARGDTLRANLSPLAGLWKYSQPQSHRFTRWQEDCRPCLGLRKCLLLKNIEFPIVSCDIVAETSQEFRDVPNSARTRRACVMCFAGPSHRATRFQIKIGPVAKVLMVS
jgi:hypothetical protein